MALLAPAAASAKPIDVIKDCASDEKVDGDYSKSELRESIKLLRSKFTDLSDYSDCGALIRNQIDAGAPGAKAASAGNKGLDGGDSGGGTDSGGDGSGDVAGASASGGARPVSDGNVRQSAERRELARKELDEGLGDRSIDPSRPGVFEQTDATNGLPLPVLLGLIALALGIAGAGLLGLKRRRPALPGGIRRRVRPSRRRD